MIKRVFIAMASVASVLISGCVFQRRYTEEQQALINYLRSHPWSRWVSSDNKMTIIGGTNKVDEYVSFVIYEVGTNKKSGLIDFQDHHGNIRSHISYTVYSEGYDYDSMWHPLCKLDTTITDDERLKITFITLEDGSVYEEFVFNHETISDDELSFYYYSVSEMYCDYLKTKIMFGANSPDGNGMLGFDAPEREGLAYYYFNYSGTMYYVEPLDEERIKIIDRASKRFDYGTAKAGYDGVIFSLENKNLSELPSHMYFRIV